MELAFAQWVCAFALVLTVVAILLVAVHRVWSPSHPLPIYLSRRLFAAHLFACLFMELRKATVWLELLSWTLALHVLYFGLCEKGARHVTRILHGPSFGGAHAMLLTYLFEQLTAPRQADEGLDSFWGAVWQFWLHCGPVLLHWADGMLNFKELQAAYSPPMTGGTTSIWDAGGLVPAMRFASSRSLLRAWSAAAGYFMLECAWSATTQVSPREFGVHKLLEVSSMEEVLRLAASLVAYSVFTHRLFTVARMRDGDLLTVVLATDFGHLCGVVVSGSPLQRTWALSLDSPEVDESEANPSAPLRREVELRCGVFVQRLNLVNIGHEVDSAEEQPAFGARCLALSSDGKASYCAVSPDGTRSVEASGKWEVINGQVVLLGQELAGPSVSHLQLSKSNTHLLGGCAYEEPVHVSLEELEAFFDKPVAFSECIPRGGHLLRLQLLEEGLSVSAPPPGGAASEAAVLTSALDSTFNTAWDTAGPASMEAPKQSARSDQATDERAYFLRTPVHALLSLANPAPNQQTDSEDGRSGPAAPRLLGVQRGITTSLPSAADIGWDEPVQAIPTKLGAYTAEWLGMDPKEDSDLLWIARRGLKTPLPKPWRPFEAASGDIFFHNPDTGESQWDHPCDHELRQLYASEKEKKKFDPDAPGTPCKDLSVSSIYEETSPQRSLDECNEQTPSPQVKVPSVRAESHGLAAASTTTAPAGTSMLCEGIKQAQLMPERPSKPPPSRLRPPRPKPLQLACDESTSFCRSPVANSPQTRPSGSAHLTSLPGREPADRERVSPGDVQSPPTPRLSAVLTAELFNGEDMDQISLWSRLEEGEETLCQPLPQTHVENCSARSLSSVHEGDSLEISSLTAALDNSNADNDSFNHCRSSSPPPQKQQAAAASRTPPWPHGSPGDASTHMTELRRLRQEIESNHVASETCETSSQSQGPKPEDFKEDAQHSHEKPVQDSTTQTDETTTASAGEGEHLSKTADSPGEELSPAPNDENSPGSDKGIPETCDVSVQKSMAYLAAELNALACKTVQRCMVPDHPLPLRDVTNEMQDLPDIGLKSSGTPRSAANVDLANMRMQLEVQEQQRATAEQQLDECLSTYRMEQAKHTATKAALRESQREVLRLQSQVQFKETETQRLEMELQRCQSELGCVFAQAKQAQVQLKAQQAELAQVKLRLRSQNSERISRTRPLQRAGGPSAAEQEPKVSSGSISQLTHDLADNANLADVAESTLRRCQSLGGSSGTRLASEVSDALRKRRRELRREHAELEQERRQWRLDARNLRRSQAADAEATCLNQMLIPHCRSFA
ncbi:Cep164 [Symbiodinium sp. CCMP2456]|nr:Cep164 [Symbiodinium sp. CCMP2456]